MGWLTRFGWRTGGEPASFALDGLDLRLAEFLDFEGGFFIEAGANDGLAQSNTLLFERRRGWRGLLVEPIPELVARCRANRRGCVVEQAALVPRGFAAATVKMRYCNLMSVVAGGMKSPAEEQAHLAAGCDCQQITSYDIDVPARSLSDLLDAHRIERVDLLSLDVEGFEAQALAGLDFSRHRPTWLLVEARYRSDVDAVLSPHYETAAELSHHDVLYRAKAA